MNNVVSIIEIVFLIAVFIWIYILYKNHKHRSMVKARITLVITSIIIVVTQFYYHKDILPNNNQEEIIQVSKIDTVAPIIVAVEEEKKEPQVKKEEQENQVKQENQVQEVRKIDSENKEGVIYLTFDDGPSLDITPKVLDILKEENIKATFFVLNYEQSKEGLIKRIVQEGHTIGIHGYSHVYKDIYFSDDAYMNNIYKLQEKIKNTTGITTKYTRFPGGSSNTVSKKYSSGIMTRLTKRVLEEGYKYYDWNVSVEDAGSSKTSEEVYNRFVNGLSDTRANIVLMHDFTGNNKTLDVLRDMIHYGKENGYTFESIDEKTPMIIHGVNN